MTAKIGHNNPPKSPFEEATATLADLHIEASNWLDGEAIENQGQADSVASLITEIRAARKAADEARKLEAKPFDDGKKEVQARYKPLLDNADLMTDGCKKLIAPYLAKVEAEKRAKAEEERKKAEEAQRAAEEAIRSADATDLEAREAAEMKIKEAKRADMIARRAENDKAAGKGGGRAVGLRSVWHGEISDLTKAARYYWSTDKDTIEAAIQSLINRDVRNGKREIPGVTITEEKVAV